MLLNTKTHSPRPNFRMELGYRGMVSETEYTEHTVSERKPLNQIVKHENLTETREATNFEFNVCYRSDFDIHGMFTFGSCHGNAKEPSGPSNVNARVSVCQPAYQQNITLRLLPSTEYQRNLRMANSGVRLPTMSRADDEN